MSMFLGPIHYMMFNKIKIAAGRVQAVTEFFTNKFPEETAEIIKDAIPEGPVAFGEKPLDELLGDAPIHQFLQSLIDRVETSEATLVTALLYRFPDNGKKLLAEAFRNHGKETAQKAMDKNGAPSDDLNGATNLLSQSYLEGMPCDPAGSYSNSDGVLEVTHSDCLHAPKWESVGAPKDLMCELLDEWVTGFAKAVNPQIKLERSGSIVKGASVCKCNLILD